MRTYLLLLALLAAALPACKSTGGMDGIKPKDLNLSASYTIYLRGDPTFYTLDALKKALGNKPAYSGNTIDLKGGKISGKHLEKPRDRNDEDAVALRLRIPGLTLRNGIVQDIPGGIVCGRPNCTFRDLTFTGTSEDYLSNNSSKSENMRVINCKFIGDSGSDKLAQWNDGRDGLSQGNYYTGGITAIRVQESTAKDKGVVRFASKNNTFVNVRTAYNVDGPKNGRTEVTVSGDKFKGVLKRYVVRERAKVIEK